MPSTDEAGRPQAALAVARRYQRRARPVTALVVVLAVAAFLGTLLATSLVPAVLVAAALVVVARAPVLRPRGTVRLRTEQEPEAVLDAFTGPTPPVLAFQWGLADGIAAGDGGVSYRVSYLFGLRTVELTVRSRRDTAASGDRIELEVTADDRPRATYAATIRPEGEGTAVDVEYGADRRFGLRRLPQRLVAARYRDEVLEVQGYTVVEREAELGV